VGDFRIVIEAVGGHGCGRGTERKLVRYDEERRPVSEGPEIALHRCRLRGCPDCATIAFVEELKRSGCSVAKALIEHWPIPGAAGTTRKENPGPIDDLVKGTRDRPF
jgi:hypothetical protein